MSSQLLSPLYVSLQVALVAGTIAIITGTIVAYFMSKYTFRFKPVCELLFLLPIVLPPSVIGFILLISIGSSSPLYPAIDFIFGQSIIFTKTAAIIASSIVAFPIMYQGAKIAFNSIDDHVIEAAVLDRANKFEIFSQIILPLSKFGLATSATLAFARAFGEFGATMMVAGNIPGKTQTLPIAIYMAMSVNDRSLAGMYVIIMLITSVCFLMITSWIQWYQKKNK